jgi:CRP-like cAMP-binding protein
MGVPLFSDCSQEQLSEIAGLAEEMSLPAGHELTHEGHRGGLFVVILHGTAEVRIGDEVVRTLGPGDFVGEIAIVLGGRSSATVVATSQVRALILAETDFRHVLQRAPGLQAKVEAEAFHRLASDDTADPGSA